MFHAAVANYQYVMGRRRQHFLDIPDPFAGNGFHGKPDQLVVIELACAELGQRSFIHE